MSWRAVGILLVFSALSPVNSLLADNSQFRLLSSHLNWQDVLPSPLTLRVRELAGRGAVNCGRVASDREVAPARDCVRAALAAEKPFYVLYDFGSLLSVGFAVKSANQAFGLSSQHFPRSREDRLTAVSCPMPLHFRLSQKGRVTCFPPHVDRNLSLDNDVVEQY